MKLDLLNGPSKTIANRNGYPWVLVTRSAAARITLVRMFECGSKEVRRVVIAKAINQIGSPSALEKYVHNVSVDKVDPDR